MRRKPTTWIGLGLAAWFTWSWQVPDCGAREVLLIGQEGHVSWEGRVAGVEGITATKPEHRSLLDPNITEIGNAPANLIEFKSSDFPGSILPRQVGEGQNLATEALERGGGMRSPTVFDLTKAQLDVILEDMLVEEQTGQAFERKNNDALGTQLILDLGARFGVNQIRFFPRNTVFPSPGTPFQNDFLKDFDVEINDGLVLTQAGNPIWETHEIRSDNTESITMVNIDPPRYIRFIRLRVTSSAPFEIEKFQVFGEGFFPSVRYISHIIDMGRPANWGLVRILQEEVGETAAIDMQIRTRSGGDPTPFVYTRKQVAKQDAEEIPFSVDDPNQPLSRKEYLKLPEVGRESDPWERGSVKDDLANWSPWSSPYTLEELTNATGTQVLSPGPARYFQFLVDFQSDDLKSSHVLRQIALEFSSPPLADALIAEIFPREVDAATDIPFVYAVRAERESTDLKSFDSFEISTPSRMSLLERLEIIAPDGSKRVDHTFAVQDGVTEEGEVAITSIADRSFAVRFPGISEHGTMLKIHFVGRVLSFSTRFTGRALLLEEDAFQSVTPGNAALLGEGDTATQSGFTVLSPSVNRGSLVGDFTLGTGIITPNGDGVNDALELEYEILAVVGRARILVDIHDLRGRRVRRLFEMEGQNGVYDSAHFPALRWDGGSALSRFGVQNS